MDLSKLDTDLKAVAPVVGVSVGSKDDPLTWRIDFDGTPTPQQKAAAKAVLDKFDPNTEPAPVPTMDDKVKKLLDLLVAKALITDKDAQGI